MKKYIFLLTVTLFLGIFGSSCTSSSQIVPSPSAGEESVTSVEGEPITLGIVQPFESPQFDEYQKALLAELENKGYVEGKNLTLDYQNAQGDFSLIPTIISKFTSEEVDVILCVTTPACIPTAKASDTTPVVFSYMNDPVGAGVVPSIKQHGGNITGVQNSIPTEGWINMLKEIVPGVKKVGAISNLGESNAQYEIKQIKEYIAGSEIELVEANVTSVSEVLTAAQSLVGRVDVILLVGDNTVRQATAAIIQVGETSQIPVFGSMFYDVNKGVIAAYNYDVTDYGRQVGVLLSRVLGGEDPGSIDVQIPDNYYLSLNLGAAGRFGVELSPDVINKAKMVVEE